MNNIDDYHAVIGKICISLDTAKEGILLVEQLAEICTQLGFQEVKAFEELKNMNKIFIDMIDFYTTNLREFLLKSALEEQ